MSKPTGVQRAYSLLTIKAVDEESRVIEGIASTPTTDRMGDIVEPKGAQFKLPLPLLSQHNPNKPIGHVIAAKATADGIEIKAKLVKPFEGAPQSWADRLNEAWADIKTGLVRGLSIGFQPLESARIEGTYGYRFMAWDWLELSAVTIPANAEATIQTVKSIDSQLRAASGHMQKAVVRLDNPPGASGNNGSTSTPKQQEKHVMKNLKEQIASFEAKRQAAAARMETIMQKSADEGRTLDDSETEEYDNLKKEVDSVDEHLVRLRDMDKLTMKAVDKTSTNGAGSGSRGPAIIINREPEDKFKGQSFTRIVVAKALAHLNQSSAAVEAQRRGWHKTHPTLFALIKANEVAAGGSGSGDWGDELVQADTRFTGDFIEFLNGLTVYDRLPLRQIPANVVVKGQDGAATGYWVGEGKAIPVSAADFSDVTLNPLKVAALAVVTNELLRDSSPAAEQLVRDALANAIAQRIDTTFISAAAASAGVSPAGILNGVSPVPSSGWDGDAVRADIKSLYAAFITAKNASGLQFVMNPSLAKALQLMRNALGQREFPDITSGGGSLEGDAVVTGDNVNPLHLVLLKPSDIYRIGDGGIQVSVSRDATIEMSSAPAADAKAPTGQTQNPVSMFQTESTAFKVVRPINFAKRRSSAVGFVADAEYGTESQST